TPPASLLIEDAPWEVTRCVGGPSLALAYCAQNPGSPVRPVMSDWQLSATPPSPEKGGQACVPSHSGAHQPAFWSQKELAPQLAPPMVQSSKSAVVPGMRQVKKTPPPVPKWVT